MAQKRAFNEGKRHFKKNKKQKTSDVPQGSNEEVLLADVKRMLRDTKVQSSTGEQVKSLPEQHTELDLDIIELSSTGDGLALRDGQIYVVPFSAPGDTVKARVYKHNEEEHYSLADFLSVVKASEFRTEEPKCKYFGQCSGCQLQYAPYSYQLAHKQNIVRKAYRNFSKLAPELVPEIGETVGSPLQYGYRTKLTPHFDAPPGARRANRKGEKVNWEKVPEIGYMKKGTQKTMDIEDCPIGTEAVRRGLAKERGRVSKNISQYARGATLLLRESTQRVAKTDNEDKTKDEEAVLEDCGKWLHEKTCITNHKATSTEYVEDFRFDNPAGSFFQNNNSILPLVTQYIRERIVGTQASDPGQSNIKYMIDAYCGSGFFTVTLSTMFERSIGIDISPQSIDYASRNAELNNLPKDSTNFLAADANKLFDAQTLDHAKFPPAETVVIIDPPRKGCDTNFIRQLLSYGPQRICYVSCNVHTQARDVGWLVNGVEVASTEDGSVSERLEGLYEIESLRGFDFFPQTGHVEGVALLRRKPCPA